ncbi:MAG: hypothetical protein ABI718_01810 [Acidobacteriota bacterium]
MPQSQHLSDLDLIEWLEGTPSGPIITHAYTCTECAVLLDAIDTRPVEIQIPNAEAALERAMESEREIESEEQKSRTESDAIVQALRIGSALPSNEQASAGLVRNLLRSAREELSRDPALALRCADAASRVLVALDRARYETQQIDVLQGETEKERANALRLLGRFREGLSACDAAESAFSRMQVSEPWLAMCAYVRATLLRELDELQPARKLTAFASEIFERFGMEQRVVHSRILESTILLRDGNALEARSILEDLARLPLEPLDRAFVLNDLSFATLQIGRVDLALQHSAQAAVIFQEMGATLEGLRSSWNLAKALLSMNHIKAAFPLLDEIRSRFAALEIREEETLVLLDIAEGLLDQGYPETCRELCQALIARYASENPSHVPRIVQALDSAIRSDALSRATVSDLRRQLQVTPR